MKLQRFSGNPILSPNPANPWENLVTCNPGVILDDGVFYMLYRAAGDDEKHVIRFGLATSTDGFHFNRVGAEPVFGPSADGPDSGCVEDPRMEGEPGQHRPGLHPRLPHLPSPGPPDFARPGRPGRDPVPGEDRWPVCDAASA